MLLALVTTACMTGERPTLGEPVALGGQAGTPTGNVAVDTVLQQLERTDQPTFTAGYDITRKLGPNSTDGLVVQDEDDTSITVGDVRFLQGTESSTCDLSEQTCEEGTLDARISDYSVGSGFYADAPARALRVAFERRSGEPTASQATDRRHRRRRASRCPSDPGPRPTAPRRSGPSPAGTPPPSTSSSPRCRTSPTSPPSPCPADDPPGTQPAREAGTSSTRQSSARRQASTTTRS